MAYVAAQRLRWGDHDLAPGDPVPADEPERDYPGMLHLGQIREVSNADLPADEVVRKLDLAEKRVKELEAQAADDSEANTAEPEDGPLLVLDEKQRAFLVEHGLDGEFTLEDLDTALTMAAEDNEPDTPPAETPTDDEANPPADDDPPADTGDALPDGVTDLGGGWYVLADGETKVHGRKALDAALNPAE